VRNATALVVEKHAGKPHPCMKAPKHARLARYQVPPKNVAAGHKIVNKMIVFDCSGIMTSM
jgi:hypothetical protein